MEASEADEAFVIRVVSVLGMGQRSFLGELVDESFGFGLHALRWVVDLNSIQAVPDVLRALGRSRNDFGFRVLYLRRAFRDLGQFLKCHVTLWDELPDAEHVLRYGDVFLVDSSGTFVDKVESVFDIGLVD